MEVLVTVRCFDLKGLGLLARIFCMQATPEETGSVVLSRMAR